MQIWIVCMLCIYKKKAFKGCSIGNGVAVEWNSALLSGAFFFHWLIPRIGWSSGRLSPARSQTLKRLRKTWLGTFGGLLFVIKALGKNAMQNLGHFFRFLSTREQNSKATIFFPQTITKNNQQSPTTPIITDNVVTI